VHITPIRESPPIPGEEKISEYYLTQSTISGIEQFIPNCFPGGISVKKLGIYHRFARYS
jgi:hypothetical protein